MVSTVGIVVVVGFLAFVAYKLLAGNGFFDKRSPEEKLEELKFKKELAKANAELEREKASLEEQRARVRMAKQRCASGGKGVGFGSSNAFFNTDSEYAWPPKKKGE